MYLECVFTPSTGDASAAVQRRIVATQYWFSGLLLMSAVATRSQHRHCAVSCSVVECSLVCVGNWQKKTKYALYSNFIVNNVCIQDTQIWAARRYIHFMTIRSEGKVWLTFSCTIAQSRYQPLFYPLQRTNDGPILGWWKMYSNTLPWKCNWSCSGFGRGQKKHKSRLYFHVH